MRRKGISARLASLLLAVVCVAALLPAAPANAIGMGNVDVSFSDVPEGSWYHDYVYLCASWGIIDGKENGQFCPTDSLKRGEFMKLLTLIGGLAPYTWDTSAHWSQPYWQILNDNGVLWGLDITCTRSALEQPITRYEMSVMINNLCNNVYSETPVTMESPASVIGDYNTMASKYHEPVVQAYGKGILDGYDDGMFHGESTLTRGQAAAVVVRTWITSERLEVSSATEVETPTGGDSSSSMDPTDSFAWRSRSMIDAWGKVTAEGRQLLFGDSNKSCFTGNESNLSDYIVTIQVRTWDINSAGEKYTRTWNLEVNKMVADEVKAIFEEIYNDPEQFPIHALGGARYTDSLRHAWGCAIDINPVENFYCNTTTSPYTAITGTTCFKYSDSPYCITPDSSVVKAFAKYGWGWGGGDADNNYSGWNTTADYMHFSILASGG